MKKKEFLCEYNPDFRDLCESRIVVNEETKEKTLYLDGIWGQFEKWNGNTRLYPVSEGSRVVNEYNQERLPNRDRIFGELDHGDTDRPKFSRMSHIFEESLRIENNDMYTKARILNNTKEGQTLAVVLTEKLKFGVSTKGMGYLSDYQNANGEGKLVSDWVMNNVGDVVVDQSAPDATPTILMEMLMSGDTRLEEIFGYETVNRARREINKASRSRIFDEKMRVWQEIMNYDVIR